MNFKKYIGSTTPIGLYPDGAASVGDHRVYDLCGNVWEWCLDHDHHGRDRVLRGGSWYDSAGYCRAAYRFWDLPSIRSHDFGFRVVFDAPQVNKK